MAQKFFIKLILGNETFGPAKVCSDGCSDVDDLRKTIKSTFSPTLDSYGAYQLTLHTPDGKTEIDPQTPVGDLKDIPWNPMVVTVKTSPIQAPSSSSKKQLVYKGMTSEASCRKYLDALAIEISFEYDFRKAYTKPTMGDVLGGAGGGGGGTGV